MRRVTTMLVLALWLVASHACAQAPPIEYTVSLPAPQTQMVEIEMRVRDVVTDTLDFLMPVWRPGRYVILDSSHAVREVYAFSANDLPIACEKIDKATWRVSKHPNDDEVRLIYRVYCNALGERTRHVDDTHAFLSPAAVFMYLAERRDQPLLVHIGAPADWKIATGLEALPDAPRTLAAPNYDVLVDSPIEIGVHEMLEFQAAGKPHQIAIWGNYPADFAREKLKTDFAKIVEIETALFGGAPYERYVFITHVGAGAGGGTEHVNSTVIQTGRAAFEDDDAYQRFLGLVSHEMFHTWNVKSFRPSGIHPYDYQRENYTKLLWVAEGTTSYYDDLMLVRAGFTKPDKYLENLGNAIDAMRNRPGETEQSVEDASFESWTQFSRSWPDKVNCTVDFYGKGALVSLLLDLEMRRRSDGRAALDQVMQALYERFPLASAGYTAEDLIAIIEEIAGSEFEDVYALNIRGASPLDLEAAFAVVGVELYFKPTSKNDQKDDKNEDEAGDDEPEPATQPDVSATQPDEVEAPAASRPEEEEEEEKVKMKAYLGLNLSDSGGRTTVSSVLSDGPAYAAGMLAGDEIIALNGRRITAADLDKRLEKLDPGAVAKILLARHEHLRTVEITLAGKPDGKWKLRRVKEPTDLQQAQYESWLGQPWPKK